MKLDPYLASPTKINSKCIQYLKVRPESIKPLEENIGKNLLYIGFSNDFLDMTPKAQAAIAKIDMRNYINIIKDTWTKPRGRVEAGEGGGFGWGGIERWRENVDNGN